MKVLFQIFKVYRKSFCDTFSSLNYFLHDTLTVTSCELLDVVETSSKQNTKMSDILQCMPPKLPSILDAIYSLWPEYRQFYGKLKKSNQTFMEM
jgi:hypothetical protein